jgi:hypothetical protein
MQLKQSNHVRMAMLEGVSKPKEMVSITNDIDLDIFAQNQKELA